MLGRYDFVDGLFMRDGKCRVQLGEDQVVL
jgi:hypothetical protein